MRFSSFQNSRKNLKKFFYPLQRLVADALTASKDRADVQGSPFVLLIEPEQSMCAKAWIPVDAGYAVFCEGKASALDDPSCGSRNRAVAPTLVGEVDYAEFRAVGVPGTANLACYGRSEPGLPVPKTVSMRTEIETSASYGKLFITNVVLKS
jgi:hypothetical protein